MGIGPLASPLEAFLPPLPAGIASLRVHYVSPHYVSPSNETLGTWKSVECRACFFVGQSALWPAGRAVAEIGPGADNREDIAGIRTGEEVAMGMSSKGFGATLGLHDIDGDG